MREKALPIIIGLLITLLVVWLQVTHLHTVRHLLTRLDYIAYDLQLRSHVLTSKKIDTPIRIVDIDEKSLRAEGR